MKKFFNKFKAERQKSEDTIRKVDPEIIQTETTATVEDEKTASDDLICAAEAKEQSDKVYQEQLDKRPFVNRDNVVKEILNAVSDGNHSAWFRNTQISKELKQELEQKGYDVRENDIHNGWHITW